MSDLINRQDAIDAIKCDIVVTGTENAEVVVETLVSFVDAIKSLPSAEPKTGEWYIREYEYFTCSECGEDYWNSCDSTAEAKELLETGDYPNFCPNCGAKMGGGEQNDS